MMISCVLQFLKGQDNSGTVQLSKDSLACRPYLRLECRCHLTRMIKKSNKYIKRERETEAEIKYSFSFIWKSISLGSFLVIRSVRFCAAIQWDFHSYNLALLPYIKNYPPLSCPLILPSGRLTTLLEGLSSLMWKNSADHRLRLFACALLRRFLAFSRDLVVQGVFHQISVEISKRAKNLIK